MMKAFIVKVVNEGEKINVSIVWKIASLNMINQLVDILFIRDIIRHY